ncbi:Uncharacterised protein [Bordetella pertussis]|nr:Uncharacterised protein [Bordetella pertussis]CFW47006.1 Uncharacterised protein [Bordetella pertussis]
MVVPELKWPRMPLTSWSTSCWATCTATRGSAWSSRETSTNLAGLPPTVTPF